MNIKMTCRCGGTFEGDDGVSHGSSVSLDFRVKEWRDQHTVCLTTPAPTSAPRGEGEWGAYPGELAELQGFKTHVVKVFGDVMGELRIFRDSSTGLSMFQQCAGELRSAYRALRCPRCEKGIRRSLAWADDATTHIKLNPVCDACLGDPLYRHPAPAQPAGGEA
jgi:hypothetical protein